MKKLILPLLLLVVLFSCKKETNTAPKVEADTAIVDSIVKKSDSIIEIVEPIKKTKKEIKRELITKGFKVYSYVDKTTKDTIIMQQYFVGILKRGSIRGQNEEETANLEKEHFEFLEKIYTLGYADISGPFDDNSNTNGLTIYNVPTKKMADSLAKADPMVKAGRLKVEVRPWWAAKGLLLR